ncbi:hypothetical protein ACF0H5_023753 [Mactra antiquata]
MSSRLKTIETNVSKLLPIEQDLSKLKLKVNDLELTNKSIVNRLAEVENFCQTFSDISDDSITFKRNVQEEITQIKSKNDAYESDLSCIKQQNIELHECLLNTQTRAMENNLIFFGIDEARPDKTSQQDNTNKNVKPQREDTEQVLRDMMKSQLDENETIISQFPLNTSEMKFNKLFRVENPNKVNDTGRPRPVVAVFERYAQRESIRRAGLALNKIRHATRSTSTFLEK